MSVIDSNLTGLRQSIADELDIALSRAVLAGLQYVEAKLEPHGRAPTLTDVATACCDLPHDERAGNPLSGGDPLFMVLKRLVGPARVRSIVQRLADLGYVERIGRRSAAVRLSANGRHYLRGFLACPTGALFLASDYGPPFVPQALAMRDNTAAAAIPDRRTLSAEPERREDVDADGFVAVQA